jgi:predicted ATPase
MGRARAYAYTAVSTVVVLVFALAEWAAERFVAEHSRVAGVAIEISIVLLAAIAFRPLHRRVEAAIDAAFSRRKRQALSALAAFRQELSSFSDMQQLLRRVIEAINHHLEARACAVYLRRDGFRAEASSFDVAAGTIEPEDPLVVRLRSSGAPAHPPLLNSSAHGTHAFPVTLRGDLIGFITVHARYEYDDEELQMLSGLAQDLAPALAALDPRLRPQTARPPNNLPADLPVLIGREHELAEITAALAQSKIVTLVGTGGVGKTALALHCASQEMQTHEDGAWFVNLAPITDGTLVTTTIASALGGSDLFEHLQDRDALVVLDNCEQVIGHVSAAVSEIAARCPRVRVLATSRELLHVANEQVYRLRPLRTEAATELFVQRAKAIAPAFDAGAHAGAVKSICEQLDGIPLAVELAAARVRALSPEDILAHLDQRFRLLTTDSRTALPRHQTLHATMEWSYGLLTSEEQTLFRALSAFRGSFSLAAAAAVCSKNEACDEYHVLDLLTSLTDKSLVIVRLGTTTRYRLLETLREFAVKKALEEQAESIARNQHAAYFAALAAQAYHEFDSRMPAGWLDRLAPDLDNFRAALEWMLQDGGDRRAGAQLAADCGPVFLRLTLLEEGLRWCDSALQVDALTAATKARLHYVQSMLHNNLGEFKRALASAQAAVEYYRATDDDRGFIRALSQLANQYARTGRLDDAREPAREAMQRARALGEPRVLVAVLRRCASALAPPQIEEARALFREALDVARSVQEPEEACMVLDWWSSHEAASGDIERAIDLALQGLACARDASAQIALEMKIAGWMIALERFPGAQPHAARALELTAHASSPLARSLALAYWAGLHAATDPSGAATLFGYAQARLNLLEWTPQADDELALRNIRREIQSRVGPGRFDALLEGGAAVDESVALAAVRAELVSSAAGSSSAVDPQR